MSRERDIILALNENRRMEESFDDGGQTLAPKDDRRSIVKRTSLVKAPEDGIKLNTFEDFDDVYDDDAYEIDDDDLVYVCPVCGEEFVSDAVIDGTCECPECGDIVTPEYEGTVAAVYGTDDVYDDDALYDYDDDPYDEYSDGCDDYDDYDDEPYYGEAVQKMVRGGKVIKKKVKAGYKNVNGKLVKMTSKEKRARQKAIKKAQKKAHTAGANKHRARSMKVARKKGLVGDSLDLNFNEHAFMDLMNGVISDVMENYETYETFQIESINEATMSEHDLDTLTVEATVTYEDGTQADAQFVIEGLLSDNGIVTIKEQNNVFDPHGLKVFAKLDETYNTVELTEMKYRLRNRQHDLSESFEYIR